MEEKEFLYEGRKKSIFTLPSKVVLFFVLLFLLVYLSDVLFGTRSVNEMLKLYHQEKDLKNKIKKAKKENEKLQRELFNYEVLVPDGN